MKSTFIFGNKRYQYFYIDKTTEVQTTPNPQY